MVNYTIPRSAVYRIQIKRVKIILSNYSSLQQRCAL